MGFFANQIAALPVDLQELITTNYFELFNVISELVMDRRLIISAVKLKQFHSLYCVLNAEQDFFNLLMNAYKEELCLKDRYLHEQLYIREQYQTHYSVYYNRKRHLVIDKYLHQNFGISGFVTDDFMQLLATPCAPIDNFEGLIKFYCIKHIYENNKAEAKYLFDEPPGLNDDHFIEGLVQDDKVMTVQHSPSLP